MKKRNRIKNTGFAWILMGSIILSCVGCNNTYDDYYTNHYDKGTAISHSTEEKADIDFEAGKVSYSEFEIKGSIQQPNMNYSQISLSEGEIVLKVMTKEGEELANKTISASDKKEGSLTVNDEVSDQTCQIIVDATNASSGAITLEWEYETEKVI